MRNTVQGRLVGATLGAAALLAAGCGGSDSGGGDGASGSDSGGKSASTVKLGAISSLTGPLQFPETQQAAKAVFDRVNAQGGVNGHKIQYSVEDDRGTPAVAAQAARRLIDQKGVMSLVGGTSIASCAVNAPYLKRKGILAVEGTAVLPQCFTSENIAPVDPGPYAGYTALLHFASQTLKHDKVCGILLNVPGLNDAYLAAIERWKKLDGKQLTAFDNSLTVTDDPTPAVIKMKRAGCQAVVFNANEPQVPGIMKAAADQGVLKDVDWITLTSAYTVAEGKALAKQNTTGMYANSEYEPYTIDSPALQDWRSLMEGAGIPLSSFSQGGYISAQIAIAAIKAIQGDVTSEKLTAAIHKLKYENPMIGSPYTFAPAKAHAPNQASKFVKVLPSGAWEVVEGDWLRLPAA